MKILFEDYTFNAAAKTITFNTTDVISLQQLLIITNVSDNLIIYNFADPNYGGTITNNVLTLNYNTSLMSDNDSLQIFLESHYTPASQETLQYLSDQTALLSRMVKLLEPSARQDTTGRQSIDIGSSTGVVNIRPYDTYFSPTYTSNMQPGEFLFVIPSRIAYATLRNKLEFS